MSWSNSLKLDKNGRFSLRAALPHKDVSSVAHYKLEAQDDGTVVLSLYDETLTLIKDLPALPNLRCTKNLVLMTKTITTKCWNLAKDSVITNIDSEEDFKSSKSLMDEKYRELLCKLDTDVLEAILLCHNKKKMYRAAVTIQAISTELTRRALLGDSSK